MQRQLEKAGTRVYSALLSTRPSTLSERVYRTMRDLIVRLGDPAVRLDVADSRLEMPLSHNLPLYISRFPLYSANLARLATACVDKYPDLVAVDIGANIGDSLAFLRCAGVGEVLCVEGDARYLEFLRRNTRQFGPGVVIAPVLVGASTGMLDAELVRSRGTGRLRLSSARSDALLAVATLSLDDLLARYPITGRLKLLKSDTDGFEGHILEGGVSSLRRHRPVLFFEYDPLMLAKSGSHGLRLLHALRDEGGYSHALFYDNFGDLLLSAGLDDTVLLTELDRYFAGHQSGRYLDIAAFHAEDNDLFRSFRASEHEYYGAVMASRLPPHASPAAANGAGGGPPRSIRRV